MKLRRKIDVKQIQDADKILSTIGLATAHAVIAELHQSPITIKHDIKRNIPKPVTATLIAENSRGEQFRQWMNMSFQNTMVMRFPLFHFTGRPEDQGHYIDISMLLEYDPKDTK